MSDRDEWLTIELAQMSLELSRRIDGAMLATRWMIFHLNQMAESGKMRWDFIAEQKQKVVTVRNHIFDVNNGKVDRLLRVIEIANSSRLRGQIEWGFQTKKNMPPLPPDDVMISAHNAAIYYVTYISEACMYGQQQGKKKTPPILDAIGELPNPKMLLREIAIERLPLKRWLLSHGVDVLGETSRVAALPQSAGKTLPGRMSPILDKSSMIELLKRNMIGGKRRPSDETIRNYKNRWKANHIEGTNYQRFYFDLEVLDEMNVRYDPSWNESPFE